MRAKRYTERLSFTVPKDVKERIKLRAKLEGISLSELVRCITDEPDQ
jgi:predicted HicB family RNase H-like nuclease